LTTPTEVKSVYTKTATASEKKAQYAQYFTPEAVAEFMVAMFSDCSSTKASVLDPGAGEGVLGLALAKRLSMNNRLSSLKLIEIDKLVFQNLEDNARQLDYGCQAELINADFTREAFRMLHVGERFSHVIMNPPYFKLQRGSGISSYLMSCGVNVTNIYAAFMWLGLLLLEDGGQLVAIVPRSFCNGPYFMKFREYIVHCASIEAIHTFSTRNKVFSKDQVLQENVIIHFAKKPQTETVRVTYSNDQSFCDVLQAEFQASEVIDRDNPDLTISIPPYNTLTNLSDYAGCSLADIELEVSTGPVVDFRLRDQIGESGGKGSVPLLYPAHMKEGQIIWPLDNLPKKGQFYYPQPNLLDGIDPVFKGDKNVSPSVGYYVVVRRFSSKEEKRRIFAAVVETSCFAKGVAFENHLNYFHNKKHGFDAELAYGLTAYLNSSILDEHFRTFSGHTQVNATDLRNIPYPSQKQLRQIGQIAQREPTVIEYVVTPDVLKEYR
jgi:adenine-specific DNA-methyltransferase